MKIVIIEDEVLTANDLARTLVSIDSDIEIIAKITTVEEGVLFFQTSPKIDLIFSDIELGDGLSFEIFQDTPYSAPIIFCTAFQQYALEAFKTMGIDYVLKPFTKNSIEKALLKFKNIKESTTTAAPAAIDINSMIRLLKVNLQGDLPSVIVHQGDKILPIQGKDIAFFYIENEATYLFGFDTKRYLISQKLDNLEKLFPDFFRANRQFLINRKVVKDASQYFNRKLLVNLNVSFAEQIIIGKLKTTEFIQWLTNQ